MNCFHCRMHWCILCILLHSKDEPPTGTLGLLALGKASWMVGGQGVATSHPTTYANSRAAWLLQMKADAPPNDSELKSRSMCLKVMAMRCDWDSVRTMIAKEAGP